MNPRSEPEGLPEPLGSSASQPSPDCREALSKAFIYPAHSPWPVRAGGCRTPSCPVRSQDGLRWSSQQEQPASPVCALAVQPSPLTDAENEVLRGQLITAYLTELELRHPSSQPRGLSIRPSVVTRAQKSYFWPLEPYPSQMLCACRLGTA